MNFLEEFSRNKNFTDSPIYLYDIEEALVCALVSSTMKASFVGFSLLYN